VLCAKKKKKKKTHKFLEMNLSKICTAILQYLESLNFETLKSYHRRKQARGRKGEFGVERRLAGKFKKGRRKKKKKKAQ
jgi:hypothetical protein